MRKSKKNNIAIIAGYKFKRREFHVGKPVERREYLRDGLSLIGFGSEENNFNFRVTYKQAKKLDSSVTTGTCDTNFGHGVILKSAVNIVRKPKARDKDRGYSSIEWFKIIVEFNLEVTNVFETRIYAAVGYRRVNV